MTTTVDAGTYEVLRDRLVAQAKELADRAGQLNVRRTEEFGSAELKLVGTERLRTEHNSVPRDILAVGDVLLFGYNVHAGVRPETTVADVFALHDRELEPLPADAVPGLLDDPAFRREFEALYRYYRETRLMQLRHVDGKVLAVFRTGERAADIRVLRWAVGTDGTATFLDARGERDHVFPDSHDFDWTPAPREAHVLGRHPHISIGDEVFVSAVGGALTVKLDNDTETDEGIHSEPVDEPLQSLADASVEHARVGPLLLLRILPYKEKQHRYLVFNTLTKGVVRLDGIGQACRRLPEDQGIVFPGGYYIAATGSAKTFDTDTADLEYERTVRSPNGEDVLFAFHAREAGRTLLLPYNVIRKEVASPLSCHGYAVFDDGTLFVLRAGDDEPARVHPLQVWQSPFVSDTYAAATPAGSGPLARIGNADLVRGISDSLSVARAVTETTPTAEVYDALAASCVRALDQYHWMSDPEAGGLLEPLTGIRDTAQQVLAEFETVQSLTREAAGALTEAAEQLTALVRRVRGESPRSADVWVSQLTELRHAQGHLLTLKEMRYADVERIDELSDGVEADIASTAGRAIEFLRRDDAFDDQHAEVARLTEQAAGLATVAEAEPVAARLDERTEGLQILTETVAGLDMGDATVRTAVLERIAEVLGGVNRARATLDARRRELRGQEGRAEFAAEFALLGQAVTGALAAAGTPEACDEQLSRLLLQLENLESRFAEDDTFLGELADRRSEIYEAFSSRKQTLQDARARHAERLAESAVRVLDTVTRRAATLPDQDAVATFFASDPMVAKVLRTADELRELGDQVRAEELAGRIKSARQEATRALRDRTELYADGGDTIRLGRHRFAVNTQPLDLTLVPSGDTLAFALTGTDYRAPVTDPGFAATRPYWGRSLPSETAEVYRAEHLAARLLAEHGHEALAAADLPVLVREAAEAAYDEGYERGVHDRDATAILTTLLRLHATAGLLRFPARERAAAQLYWAHGTTDDERTALTRRAVSLARARETFGLAPAIDELTAELALSLGEFASTHQIADADPALAAGYLFEELTSEQAGFVTGAPARALLDGFRAALADKSEGYDADLVSLATLRSRRQLVDGWLASYAATLDPTADPGDLAEAAAVELCPDLERYAPDAPLTATVDGLLGAHPRVEGGSLAVRVDELLTRTARFRSEDVPGFRAYQRRRTEVVDAERRRLRLDEFRPRVMSSFVRSRLIDEVYLPLIGDSLAKQIGAAGDSKRTDTGGLLLLVSPPGYGKTTLVEYVADRLGLVLVKVNGPALGHDVTSLDPAQAPDATSRQEVEKINFALEAGNNTLLYLDDIQHTSPELLQKFISLCDGQRRIEGVVDGESRTYDLRGKRFAVCMAGNPYTESGQRFRIPDMLANRADVWNLGEVLTGKEDAFAMSFVENSLTSNSVLAQLAGRDRADLDLLVRLAEDDPTARRDRLTHSYPPAELDRILRVLRHLLAARRTVLAVNEAYIASAARTDESRTEPPFQLQGSYRNMNKIVARIDPVMNDEELAAVLTDHYAGEAQTLTSGAESNLLKLGELRGTLTAEQAERWSAVKSTYQRGQALGGPEEDPTVRAVAALVLLADRITAVETAITRATDPRHLLANPEARHAVPRNGAGPALGGGSREADVI
ncbi:ATPase involved in DNA repair [Streptomyces sp. YIM 130001]|uniref:DNA repair ATPase n=1 Tax=Streptomyces sp. YIM 130001 TaxID=2259644 RepID=UPI000E651B3E|nr:DNA repair ATPase [Streptomyces sp. YIM 130001]RII09196.1 ATPase involved in DNA repair [Streptomyces sp. YIM 130001]